MATTEQKDKMGRKIVEFEARRNGKGHLQVYRLPSGDGGGCYEVAGINNGYHPAQAAALKSLIESGRYEDAEMRAAEYIIEYTACVERWLGGGRPKSEFYLRDTAFNAGSGGATRVLQMAVGSQVDGIFGPATRSATEHFLRRKGDTGLLAELHAARWSYMQCRAQRPAKKKFWLGWKNRMKQALQFAETL